MENILPKEKSFKTAFYTAFRNTTKFCEFLLEVRISKHTRQDLTSHPTPVSRGWQKSLDKVFFSPQINRISPKYAHSHIPCCMPRAPNT